MDKSSLTIAVLTYNRSKYLKQALTAIKNQTYRDFVVKIYDNASTDETSEVVAEFLNDHRFVYIKHNNNLGACGNYNFCLEDIDTDFAILTHDDDIMKDNFVAEEIKIMLSDESINLVSTDVDCIDDSGKQIEFNTGAVAYGLTEDKILNKNEYIELYVNNTNFICCPTVMLRMAVIRLNELKFCENAGPAIDALFWMQLNTHEGKFYYISKALYNYRLHAAQDTNDRASITDFKLSKAVFELIDQQDLQYKHQWVSVSKNAVKREILRRIREESISSQTFINLMKDYHYLPLNLRIRLTLSFKFVVIYKIYFGMYSFCKSFLKKLRGK